MYGLWLGGIKEIEDQELIRLLAYFLGDEFLVRLRWPIHGENIRWHLSFGHQRGVL